MSTSDISLRTLRAYAELVDDYKLDSLEIGGVKITKTKHVPIVQSVPVAKQSKKAPVTIQEMTDDELTMFWSVEN